MLVSKNAKICVTPNGKHEICVTPTQNPNANEWNIGCVGSPMQHFRVGHVHFMLFVLISFALVTQCEPSLQWNMGLTVKLKHPFKVHIISIRKKSSPALESTIPQYYGGPKVHFLFSVHLPNWMRRRGNGVRRRGNGLQRRESVLWGHRSLPRLFP